MRKKVLTGFMMLIMALFLSSESFAGCGTCGTDHSHEKGSKHESKGSAEHAKEKKGSGPCFPGICDAAVEKGGVKEITYEQFQQIRSSGEKYVLLDTLSPESYAKGHIEGAINF